MAFTLIDDFESGSDGGTFSATGNWATVSGTPLYEADAAVHGSMGLRLDGSTDTARYVASGSCSGSSYHLLAAVSTGANRFIVIMTSGGVQAITLRHHNNGTFSMINVGGTQIGSATTLTWTAGQVVRVDWQLTSSGTNPNIVLDWSVRFFLGSNSEGTTADETLTQQVTGQVSSTGHVGFLTTGTSGSLTNIDTVRHSTSLEWAGPLSTGSDVTEDDPLGLVDGITRDLDRPLTDPLGLVDEVLGGLSGSADRTITDDLGLADPKTWVQTTTFRLGLTDPIAVATGDSSAQTMTDVLGLTDPKVWVQTGGNDVLGLTDSISVEQEAPGADRTVADTLSIEDLPGIEVVDVEEVATDYFGILDSISIAGITTAGWPVQIATTEAPIDGLLFVYDGVDLVTPVDVQVAP